VIAAAPYAIVGVHQQLGPRSGKSFKIFAFAFGSYRPSRPHTAKFLREGIMKLTTIFFTGLLIAAPASVLAESTPYPDFDAIKKTGEPTESTPAKPQEETKKAAEPAVETKAAPVETPKAEEPATSPVATQTETATPAESKPASETKEAKGAQEAKGDTAYPDFDAIKKTQ
jgi:hypothetical protein